LRRSEAPCDDPIDECWQQAGEGARLGGEHLDPLAEAEAGDEAAQVIGTRCSPIDEAEVEVRSPPGDHQPGDSAATAEVDDRSGGRRKGVDEQFAVGDHLAHRSGAEHAPSLRVGERLEQLVVRVGRNRRRLSWRSG
jgi:hypothetical protein